MQDYRPNSHKAKAEEKTALAEKKVEKVVNGTVKVRKKNAAHKMADAFVSEDAANVKSYILMDVIIPTVKDLVSDIVKNSVDIILFGGSGARRSGGSSRRRDTGYVEYNRFSDRRDDRRDTRRVSVASRFNLDDIELETKGEAEYVLAQMDALLDTYGMVSVGDLYDMVGLSHNRDYVDQDYGWTSLNNAKIYRVRGGGYALDLPKVVSLK